MESQNNKNRRAPHTGRSPYVKCSDTATNYDYESRLESLEKYLDRTDLVGYIAARNSQAITEALKPYIDIKNKLVFKYGTEIENEPGRYHINADNPNFKTFAEELDETGSLKVTLDIYKIRYHKVIGVLSGKEILLLGWMLED